VRGACAAIMALLFTAGSASSWRARKIAAGTLLFLATSRRTALSESRASLARSAVGVTALPATPLLTVCAKHGLAVRYLRMCGKEGLATWASPESASRTSAGACACVAT